MARDQANTKPRIIFIHGNDTIHWSFAWTPWLKRELEELGFETHFETFPDSIIARAKYWLPFLEDYIRAGENDVLIGWSSGATAAMRYTETHQIRGSILIGPSYTDLDDDLEKQSGYFDKPWDWPAIREHQDKIAVIYGDDDPYIPQADFEVIAEQLKAETIKIPGGKHFIEQDTFPELLVYVKQAY